MTAGGGPGTFPKNYQVPGNKCNIDYSIKISIPGMIVRGQIDYMRRYSTIVPVACSTRLDTKSKFRALVCVDAGIAKCGAVHNIKKCFEEIGQEGGIPPGFMSFGSTEMKRSRIMPALAPNSLKFKSDALP